MSAAAALLLSALAALNAPKVEQRVSLSSVQLGEPFVYEVVLTHAPSQRYELKAPADLGDFELLDAARSRRDGKDQAVTTFRLQMALYALGKHAVPYLQFEVVEGDNVGTYALPGPQVEGVSSLPPQTDEQGASLREIQPPVEAPIPSWRLLYALAASLALGAIAFLLYRWAKQRPPPSVPVAPPLPLHERTLAALDALRAAALPAKGLIQEHYFRLSEILRGYLGERYTFDALECTTPELFAALESRQTPGLSREALRRFCDEADLVKYAKATVTPAESQAALELAYQIVHQTHPPPNVPPAPQ